MAPLYADISSFQAVSDWPAYVGWSKQWDGMARILLRSSQGVGVPDTSFEQFWSNAVAQGIDRIGVYHYAYPNLQPGSAGAQQEADYFASVVGNRLRPDDWLMLDLEQQEQGAWALAFGQRLRAHYPSTPIWLYDSLSHIQQFFRDPALAALFALNVADYTLDPNARPACPSPWASYVSIQFSDKYDVPGIGPCDANVWLGEVMAVPQGPFVSYTVGKEIPAGTTLDTLAAQYGISVADIVAVNGWAAPYDPTLPHAIDGHAIQLPGYQQQVIPPPIADPLAAAAKAALKAWLAEA